MNVKDALYKARGKGANVRKGHGLTLMRARDYSMISNPYWAYRLKTADAIRALLAAED